MDFGTCLVKYCLCLFNFVFVVFGIALLGLGICLAVVQSSIFSLLKFSDEQAIREFGSTTVIEQLGYVLIGLGAFIFIISFLGYCGTIKESRFLLGAYAFFLTVIFILEIVVVILYIFFRKDTETTMNKILTDSVHRFYQTEEKANPFTVTFDAIMKNGQCCGISNGTDFLQAEHFKGPEGNLVPKACCKRQDDRSCPRSPNADNSYFYNGCFSSFIQTISDKMNMAIIVAVILGLLQIIGIVFACCVYKASGYDDYK